MSTARIVVLLSGSGSNLQALLDRPGVGHLVAGVVADREGAGGLERAERAGVERSVVAFSAYDDRRAWERALVDEVERLRPSLVVLAGFMRILSGDVVGRWPVLNVHPSLLPAFPGAHAVREALAWGVKVTGCTVHFVDEQVDHGPIVAQQAVEVLPEDDEASLHRRIQAAEHRLLPDCVALHRDDRLRLSGRTVRILP